MRTWFGVILGGATVGYLLATEPALLLVLVLCVEAALIMVGRRRDGQG